ncbi:MAG: T9SS type A sorting domain-containing protein [Flavihumibacter sp.]
MAADPVLPAIPLQNVKYWTPQSDNLWSNPANWQPYGVPTSANSVIIERPAAVGWLGNDSLVIDVPATVYSLKVQSDHPQAPHLSIIQQAKFRSLKGVQLLFTVWRVNSTSSAENDWAFQNGGPEIIQNGELDAESPNTFMLFEGDVYYLRTYIALSGVNRYRGDVYIDKENLDYPTGTNILEGTRLQKIYTSGWPFMAGTFIVNNDISFVNGDGGTGATCVLQCTDLFLNKGRITGNIGYAVVEGGQLYVAHGYQSLETKLPVYGSTVLHINGPLLASDAAELVFMDGLVQITSDQPGPVQIGKGLGKLQILPAAVVQVKQPGLTLNLTSFEIAGGQFSAPSGNLTLTGSLTNNGSFLHNNGKLKMTGKGVARISGNTKTVVNDLYIQKNTGSYVLVNTMPVNVAGDLYLESGILGGNGSIELDGSVTAAGGFGAASLPLVFTGGKKQSVDFSAAPGLWDGKICFNKSTADSILLKSRWVLDASGQTIQFTKGILYATATNLLELGSSVVVTGGNDESHVNGPVLKMGDNAFTFPLGDKGIYAPARISGNGYWTKLSGTATYTASYYRENPQSVFGGTVISPLKKISTREYWQVSKQSGADAAVWLSYSAARSGSAVASGVRVAGFAVPAAEWLEKGSALATNAGVQYVGTTAAAQSAEVFTIGATSNSGNLRQDGSSVETALALSAGTASAANALTVYPNPVTANAAITVVNPAWRSGMVAITIHNAGGAVVKQALVQFDGAGRGIVSGSQLSKGVYCLRGTANDKTAVKQIVVQ